MSMWFAIAIGFFRFYFLVVFLFFIYKMTSNKIDKLNFQNFIIMHWFKYASLLCVLIFIEVQLGIYSFVNVSLLFFSLLFLSKLGINNSINSQQYFKRYIKAKLNSSLIRLEIKTPSKIFKNKRFIQFFSTDTLFPLFIISFLAGITWISRCYFFRYDLYSLSDLWLLDLFKVVSLDSQQWFTNAMNVSGSIAFVNLYSKISGTSYEIALDSMGILISILVAIIIFWTIQTITFSKYIAPTIASLSFALLYIITPINIEFVNQFSSLFLALTFAIPSFVIVSQPSLLTLNPWHYFFTFFIVYFSIGLIDYFTFFILIPAFLFVCLLLLKKSGNLFYYYSLIAFFLAFLAQITLITIATKHFEIDLINYLHYNILSLNSYTYIPQLIISINKITNYYLLIAFFTLLIVVAFVFIYSKKWKISAVFLVYFMLLILFLYSNYPWFDADLIFQTLILFFPLVIGILFSVLLSFVQPFVIRTFKFQKIIGVILILFSIPLVYNFQKKYISEFEVKPKVNHQLIEVYDKISKEYFPLSYAVVNENFTQEFSRNNHFFMNYEDFITNYLNEDYLYFKNIKNENYFKNNPQNVIPNCVLLFIYYPNTKSFEINELNKKLYAKLAVLKKRGRKMKLFYSNENFKVIEIINKPKSSKISDLIF